MRCVSWAFGVAMMLGGFVGWASGAEDARSFREEFPTGAVRRVQAEVQSSGTLKFNVPSQGITKSPFTVDAKLAFDERSMAAADGKQPGRRVRWYQEATAAIKIGSDQQASGLSDERRLIVAQGTDESAGLFSPLGPLTHEELDLLDVPGTVAGLSGLLPPGELKTGETWKIANRELAKFLRIDVVLEHKVVCKLAAIEGDVARFEMDGEVDGSTSGVSAQFNISAKYRFDMKERRITAIAMNWNEIRALGHAEPGYEVSSHLKITVAPRDEAKELSDNALTGLPKELNATAGLLRLDSPYNHFRVYYDRRWRVMLDRLNLTILRLVDQGELVAQCNIANLPPLSPGKQLSLAAFQEEVKKTLDKNFGEFVEATTSDTSTGLHVHRVVVAGVASELPVHWIYYHISQRDGRRYSAVFTVEQKLRERLGGLDQSLVSSFDMLALPEPKQAVSAEKAPEAKTPSATNSAEQPKSTAKTGEAKPTADKSASDKPVETKTAEDKTETADNGLRSVLKGPNGSKTAEKPTAAQKK